MCDLKLMSFSFYRVEVEEVKRRQHCLMFSSAGSREQTYFVNFDTLADYQRWHRQASKVSKEHRVILQKTIFPKLFSFQNQMLVPSWSCWVSTYFKDLILELPLRSG